MINYNTLIFWWIAYTTKYYFLIATIVTLNTRLGNGIVLVIFQIFWHIKFDSLYLSFAIYHLSCSSFVFLGIVIVKVCFFPGADFLLNKALVKKYQQFSDERQKTSEQNGNRITCESSPCQEQDLSSPCRLDIPSWEGPSLPPRWLRQHCKEKLLTKWALTVRGLPTCWRQPSCIS